MQNFQMVDLTPPIAVVAHDAGAANLIKGWLEDFHNLDVRFCVDGPAKDIFRKAFPQFENLTMAPIEKSLIEKKLLSKNEINWLNTYHSNVFKKLKKYMNKLEFLELKKYCSNI